jgi:hypothetical protein
MCPRFMETDTKEGQYYMGISRKKSLKTAPSALAIGVAAGSAALQASAAAQQTSDQEAVN